MVTSIHNLFPTAGPNVQFAKTEPFSALSDLFKNDGFKAMLEGKFYLAVEEFFPFVGAFADFLCLFQHH